MAGAMGMGAGDFSAPFSSSSSMQQQLNSFLKTTKKNNNNNSGFNRVKFVAALSSSIADPYETLRIRRGASESEIKKAFRRLALQYHPDVCREGNCKVKFQHINEAYDIVLSNLRGEEKHGYDEYDEGIDEQFRGMDEQFRGMNDDEWDLWEEWMGWEGAGIRDYSSHINPYI